MMSNMIRDAARATTWLNSLPSESVTGVAADTFAVPVPHAIIWDHALIARWLCGKIPLR